ncbi:hypothetical protein OS175_00595 [Marinicella sp. S1101]|uniref:hypothetical protein n=1 Tax=Marinicella marina TaxID=2996016 RepID=UPI002260AD1A|nr:hypothetical protein [Marinicella marina]MCX7552360.1 hypothetical protein [Marinicella marina]MDJ1139235.1 hypothetical protein [Marinicella marina]
MNSQKNKLTDLVTLLLVLLVTQMVQAGTLTVNDGATLRGTGVIVGDLAVNTGGTVEPFTSCLSVSNASFSSGSELKTTISGNSPCSTYSQLLVNGTVDLNEASLNATTNGYSMQVLDEYVFIDNDGADSILSPFDAIGENSTYTIDGELLYASYFAGDGNDFSLLFKFIYPVGGNVTGLAAGNEVFLQINGGEIINVNANGAYQFPTDLDDNSNYEVLVINQPSTPNQTCTVNNGTGTVTGGAVTNVDVNCVTNTYAVGGNVIGLAAGNQVVIQNNGTDDLLLNGNGGFVFPTALDDESTYNILVTGNPTTPNQTCEVINGGGVINGVNVTDVVISCSTNTYSIGGTVSGLAPGNSVVLQNNLTDDLSVSANGAFLFLTALEDESVYTVTVLSQPDTPNQTCTVTNASSTLAGADVNDVSVSCEVNEYFVGGGLTGLVTENGNTLILQNNSGDDLILSDNGPFVFSQPLADKTDYDVTVATAPTEPDQNCQINQGAGTVTGDDVINVNVNCVVVTYTIGGSLNGLLPGETLTIENNGNDELILSENGDFVFTDQVDDLGTYEVTIIEKPTSPIQTCTIENATGNVSGQAVVDVIIGCGSADLIFKDGFEPLNQ